MSNIASKCVGSIAERRVEGRNIDREGWPCTQFGIGDLQELILTER